MQEVLISTQPSPAGREVNSDLAWTSIPGTRPVSHRHTHTYTRTHTGLSVWRTDPLHFESTSCKVNEVCQWAEVIDTYACVLYWHLCLTFTSVFLTVPLPVIWLCAVCCHCGHWSAILDCVGAGRRGLLFGAPFWSCFVKIDRSFNNPYREITVSQQLQDRHNTTHFLTASIPNKLKYNK